jgi:hypothetical protein
MVHRPYSCADKKKKKKRKKKKKHTHTPTLRSGIPSKKKTNNNKTNKPQ